MNAWQLGQEVDACTLLSLSLAIHISKTDCNSECVLYSPRRFYPLHVMSMPASELHSSIKASCHQTYAAIIIIYKGS